MKRYTLRGLAALFIFACMVLLFLPSLTASAAALQWETVLFSPPTEGQYTEVITIVEQTFYTSIWHYSGGYWQNDDKSIYIKDSVDMNKEGELAAALNKEIEFTMPIPEKVKVELAQGHKVIISCEAAGGLDAEKLFYLDKGDAQFMFDGNTLSFRAYPKLNFALNITYNRYVSGLDNTIPFADPVYGQNTYSIWTRGGIHLGSAVNFINPQKPMELPAPDKGMIHPSQIINNKGHLEDGFKIRVYDDVTSKESIYNSDNISIGNGTFQNAGAVGIRFWYPLQITFYLADEIMDDVAVTKIVQTRYPANQSVTGIVTVANLGQNEVATSLNFSIPGIIDQEESVTLKPNEHKDIPFDFTTPQCGSITMTAEVNRERAFPEINYDNNKLSVVANIEQLPPIEETSACNTVITWTETASHTITRSCSRHGSHSTTCTHTFVYETRLTTHHTVDPKTFKSGYGFLVNVDCAISTRMIAHYGCGSWGSGRSPSKTPAPPTKVEMRMPWKVTNKLGTQSYTVFLAKIASTGTTSKFEPAPNPISEIKAKKFYTPVELAGTKEAPKVHSFDIYVSGGGVNGVEFCKNITESITINGVMYEDDVTGGR